MRRERQGSPALLIALEATNAILCRHEWFQLQGMEGKLLPREIAAEGYAALLRSAVLHGRGEQYLPADAHRKTSRVLGRASAGWISVRAQGSADHHAPQTSERC